jgi:hypothetical protein
MQEQNPYHGTSLNAMQRQGLTSEENILSRGEQMTFDEKVEKLRLGAETIVKNTRFAIVIELYSQQHGGAENLTEETCEQFLQEHPDCPYEAGMVFAIAERMEEMKRENVLH